MKPITGVEALALALEAAQDGCDAIVETDLALAILRAEAGDGPMPEFYEPACTCPPELLERGGFRGGCPVHAQWPGAPVFRPDELLRTTPDSADTTGPLVDFEPLTDTANSQERQEEA